ncbi:MAG: hypothetical protein DWH91_16585 [Planctomycetota bacterium]|nr:MAG: hypothetical protein DWH91_16585 [Planctomycetota bacterium]
MAGQYNHSNQPFGRPFVQLCPPWGWRTARLGDADHFCRFNDNLDRSDLGSNFDREREIEQPCNCQRGLEKTTDRTMIRVMNRGRFGRLRVWLRGRMVRADMPMLLMRMACMKVCMTDRSMVGTARIPQHPVRSAVPQ